MRCAGRMQPHGKYKLIMSVGISLHASLLVSLEESFLPAPKKRNVGETREIRGETTLCFSKFKHLEMQQGNAMKRIKHRTVSIKHYSVHLQKRHPITSKFSPSQPSITFTSKQSSSSNIQHPSTKPFLLNRSSKKPLGYPYTPHSPSSHTIPG